MTEFTNHTPSPEDSNSPEQSDHAERDGWASQISIQSNATLAEKIDVTEGLSILRVIPDRAVSFLPGQHTVITLPDPDPETEDPTVKGYFSIASSPSEANSLEFLVNTRGDGRLSQLLKTLKADDRISFDTDIKGKLHLHESEQFAAVSRDRNIIMLATGTGIAPMMSILRSPETWTEGRSIRLLHGIRGISDSAYLPELLALERTRNFEYIPSLTRQDAGDSLLHGRLSPEVIEETLSPDPDFDTILVCGHFNLVGELKSHFTSLGFTDRGSSERERTFITE